ncbi:MAG: PspC domain-containing protein, partial [Bacteroidia bacterium]|nr:PspC domain-containing protein [Bacteroidia bacterium]
GAQAEAIKNYEFNNPNKLFRIKETKAIGGVCSGLAVHFGIEIWVVRLAFFIGIFVFGFSILGYFLAWLIIPMAYTDFQKTKINSNAQYVAQNNEQLGVIRSIFKIIIAGIALILIGILIVSFFFTAGMFNLFTDSNVYDFLVETFPLDENLSLMVTGVLLVLFSPILFLLIVIAKFAFKANIHIKYTGSGLIFTFFLGIGLLVYSGLTTIPDYYKLLDSTDNNIEFLPPTDSLKIIINEVNTGKSINFFSQNDLKIQLCDSGMFIPIEYQIVKTLEDKATYEIIRKYKGSVVKEGANPSPIKIDFTISNDSILFPSHYFLAKPYKFKFQKAKVKFYLKANNTFYANKTAQQAFGFIHKNENPARFWFSMEKMEDFENSDDRKQRKLEQRLEQKEREMEEKKEKLERELEQKEQEMERKTEELERKIEQEQKQIEKHL